MKNLCLLLIFISISACRLNLGSKKVPNKFTDATLRQIYTWQDERKSAEMAIWLKSPQANYRQEAALAFASLQDPEYIPELAILLGDPEPEVRRAAAYALGQTFAPASERPLQEAAESEKVPPVRAEILEALGKCATQAGLDFLSSLPLTNHAELTGQAWGLYRTNGKSLDYLAAQTRALTLLARHNPEDARLGAAQFLARTPKLNLRPLAGELIARIQQETSPHVRMALAQALGKAKTPAVSAALSQLAGKDPDYRVRINALRVLGNEDFNQVKASLYAALQDPNSQAALAAADVLLAKGVVGESPQLLQKVREQNRWRVRATLLAAALKFAPDKAPVSQLIREQFAQSANPYEKGALLSALAQDPASFSFVESQTFANPTSILATYGLQALTDMRSHSGFPMEQAGHFAQIFRRAVESGDVALIGLGAGALQNPAFNLKAAFPDYSFLQRVRNQLQLPRDMESYQELEKAIHYFAGTRALESPKNPFTHPIDWALVETLAPGQLVELKTNKGTITWQLFVEEAPGSVANFVQLTQSGFFNKKNFHRVVPNFVVQGGDPRGDGWGGPDYSIRSEFANLRYGEGYVGMASAGKDTEGCQWFITHSPTPHLDGRYTIFAKVVRGMGVVHQLEIGDRIRTVRLLD